jgi:hypothetical protein
MRQSIHQYLPGSTRFGLDPFRLVGLALVVMGIYGAGILAGGMAGHSSLAAARTGQGIPVLPWLLAFAFVILGMLGVVYGFFLRPRALEINEEEVALIKWDGKGPSMRRENLLSIESAASRIVLKGKGGDLVIPRLFQGWDALRTRLQAWARSA